VSGIAADAVTITLVALVGFAAWYVLLSLVLGIYRVGLVFGGRKRANTFAVDGSDLAGIGHRLTRARDNCYETLPVFAVLAIVASLAGKTHVTDPLALWVLFARVGQSVTHVISTSVPAVIIRANLFFVQVLIYAWWSIRLLG
jgi:uncharacterized MAPEG superfamily protein